MFDLLHLAQPIDSQSPCGPDCEYDNDFLTLSQAVAGKPEQQYGNTVIPAVEPDWRAVEQMASDLLGRTKDLRVAAWLTQAATHLHGVSGFAAGVGLIQWMCEQYWDDVHPRMVIDGEDDPYLRMNALAELSDGTGSFSGGSEIMRAVRAALLVPAPLPLTVRDVEMAAAKDAAARYADAQILSILADAVAAGSEAVKAFEQGIHSTSALAALIEERVATEDQPDLSALKFTMKAVAGAIDRAVSGARGEGSADGEAGLSGGDSVNESVGRAGSALVGDIRSREDVRRALQRVCEYLERNEPSNPASLFARRAERMLGMDFLGIMQELSPDTMGHLQMLTGSKPAE